MIFGLYWKRANATGGIASILVGLVAFISITLLKPAMGGIHPIVPTTLLSGFAFVIGSYCGKPSSEDVIRKFWGGRAKPLSE